MGNPFNVTTSIYNHYNIDKTGMTNVFDWFKENTKYDMSTKQAKTMWTTQRDSEKTVFRWTGNVNWFGVDYIQKECGREVFEFYGWRFYENEQEYVKEKLKPLLEQWEFEG